ncbi:MAG: TIGR04013 family B12-binding domain/radical SAM domain-containing protein [Planctomycetota bacterium]|nr:MAG: TIGR04013 family B12-binding domain/radical SAM domain-containing protein [Planctomycetota bacterium]
MSAPLALVLDYRRTGKYAFHTLVGSLETDPETREVPVDFVPRADDLAEAVAARLRRAERVLVCWSFYSADFLAIAARLASLRERVQDPRVLHLAGGVHASAEPRACLETGFDLVAVGEGEETIRSVVRALLAGEDPRGLRGVASLEEGELRLAGRARPVDLDAFPPFAPAHDRLGPIEITRGCIYACRFCQTPYMNRARFRHRSPENVFRWVEHLVGRGFRDFRFISPTSLSYGAQGPEPCLERLEALLAGVRERIGPARRLFYGTFPSELRPEHVTPEALALLRRYVDNRDIILGAQSGSEAVLERSKRGHGVDVIERAVAVSLQAGFTPHVDFIFGLPGEGPAEAAASLELARSLAERGARVHGHTFLPLPGTPFRDEAPGRLSAETRAALERLASRGRLYGQWKRQESIATDLAALRRPGPRRLPSTDS